MLHTADISNPARPDALLVMDWTRRIVSEFWHQGDQEHGLGLEVSPLCDRTSGFNSVPQSQLGFITFVVQPLFKQVASLITEVTAATDALENSLALWKSKKEEKATFADLYPGTDEKEMRSPEVSQDRR